MNVGRGRRATGYSAVDDIQSAPITLTRYVAAPAGSGTQKTA